MSRKQLIAGRWKIIGSLGEGGQAHTFYVQDNQREFADPLVLKRLKNSKRLGRFEREISALQSLDSEHISPIVDHSLDIDPAYIVTPYRGRDLQTSLASGLPFRSRLKIFRGAVAGVADAHRIGITHRDIKPNNVVADDNDRATVIDFGICQFLDNTLILTTTDEPFGNPAFAAPECFVGAEAVIGPTADVYSLGKLLLWLLTGGKFLYREDLTAALVRSVEHENPWVKAYVGMLVYESVVARTYADAAEMLSAVDEIFRVIAVLDQPRDPSQHEVWNSLGPNGAGDRTGSRSATTPPHGNPPGTYEVAQAFQVVDSARLERLVEITLLARNYPAESGARIRLLADNGAGPDETQVLWSGAPEADKTVLADVDAISVRPPGFIPLQPGATYWVCLSVHAEGSAVAWLAGWEGWHAAHKIFPGIGLQNRLAERERSQSWRVSEPSGAGLSLRVTTKHCEP